jgi:hypothetical protein
MLNLNNYIKGLRTGKEIHHLEREALDDAFLSDALDGYDGVLSEKHTEKIRAMQAKVSKKTHVHHRQNQYYWWAAAASFAVLLSVGGFFMLNNESNSQKKILVQQISENTDTAIAEEEKTLEMQENEIADKKLIAKNIALEDAEAADELSISEMKSYSALDVDKISDNNFEVSKETVSFDADKTLTQNKISGKVTNKIGDPLIGARVQVKNKNIATVTDIDGYFVLDVPSDEKYLQADFIGYEPKNVPIDTNQPMMIAMKDNENALSEVVVSGYNEVNRKATASAAEKVSPKAEISMMPMPVIGGKAYDNYLKTNLIRPTDEDCKKAKGKVVLQFSVNANGRPANIRIVKSICTSADNEAIRLLSAGCDWTQGNKDVKITVKF